MQTCEITNTRKNGLHHKNFILTSLEMNELQKNYPQPVQFNNY